MLQVSQQTTIDFSLKPPGVLATIEVTTAPPPLDTESAAIGTDITNEYVRDIPLRSEERRVGKECRSRWSPYH